MWTFVAGDEPVDVDLTDRPSTYAFVGRTLVRFRYRSLGRYDKRLVKRFPEKVTGYSRTQVTRLVNQRWAGMGRDPQSPPEAPCQALRASLHTVGPAVSCTSDSGPTAGLYSRQLNL